MFCPAFQSIPIHRFSLTPYYLHNDADKVIKEVSDDIMKKISDEKGFEKRRSIIQTQIANTVSILFRQKGYPFLYIGIAIEGFKSDYLH